MSKRQFHRHTKRIETNFTTETGTYTGITSDVSSNGIFIRTRYSLAPGSILSIKLRLPDGTISVLKGIVRRAIRTQISTFKNGMGIELIERDSRFIGLINELGGKETMPETEAQKGSKIPEGFLLMACSNCSAKNKVAKEKLSLNPRCGKCGTALRASDIV